MRLTDYDKLQLKLRDYADKKAAHGEIEIANGILKAKCFIDQECEIINEKQLNGGWTNAIEKPSKSDDYLVYYHKKYDSCNFETNLHGICSFIDIYGGWQTEEGETILAWQSLPEPYKEA